MGNSAVSLLGWSEAPVKIQDAVGTPFRLLGLSARPLTHCLLDGLIKVIDNSTREKEGGQFMSL